MKVVNSCIDAVGFASMLVGATIRLLSSAVCRGACRQSVVWSCITGTLPRQLSHTRGIASILQPASRSPFSLRALITQTPAAPSLASTIKLAAQSATNIAPSGIKAFSSWLPLAITGSVALTTFTDMGLWGWVAVDVGIQWLGWAVSTLLKTEKLYDLLGTGSFLALAAGSLALNSLQAPRQILVSCMVGVWALRLGSYLVARVHKVGKDSRFDEVKHQPGMFFIYWTMQALWVAITISPVLIINTASTVVPLKGWDAIGIAIWCAGMLMEGIADAQKDAWRANPSNKGKFIDVGLWSISRHPNYFGEMLVWTGMFLTCVIGFSKGSHYATVISPLGVSLLLRYVSGVPILERQADARWGGQPEYEAYKANTPILVPDVTRLLGLK